MAEKQSLTRPQEFHLRAVSRWLTDYTGAVSFLVPTLRLSHDQAQAMAQAILANQAWGARVADGRALAVWEEAEDATSFPTHYTEEEIVEATHIAQSREPRVEVAHIVEELKRLRRARVEAAKTGAQDLSRPAIAASSAPHPEDHRRTRILVQVCDDMRRRLVREEDFRREVNARMRMTDAEIARHRAELGVDTEPEEPATTAKARPASAPTVRDTRAAQTVEEAERRRVELRRQAAEIAGGEGAG